MEYMQTRFWEVDFARGLAVIAMVLFNWLFALHYFGLLENFDASQGFWWLFARTTAFAFVFIAGVAVWLAFSRKDKEQLLRHGVKIFACGMLVTIATAFFLKSGFVVFGILHSIGFSLILALPLLRLGVERLSVLAFALIGSGVLLSGLRFDFPWLLWLGFVPNGFLSLDYFPLLPWFGVFVLGVCAGKKFYPNGKRAFRFEAIPPLAGPLSFLGRHSLAVYLLHQPLLAAVLFALGLNPLGL